MPTNLAVLLAVKSRAKQRTSCLNLDSVILERLYYLFLPTISVSYHTLIKALLPKALSNISSYILISLEFS